MPAAFASSHRLRAGASIRTLVLSRCLAALGCCLPPVQRRRLPRWDKFRGSVTRPGHSLSTLGNLPSRCRSRPAAQDSLPAGGQPWPGGVGYPEGPVQSFSSLHSILLAQTLLGAMDALPPRPQRKRRTPPSQAPARSALSRPRRTKSPENRCRLWGRLAGDAMSEQFPRGICRDEFFATTGTAWRSPVPAPE